MIRTRLVQTLLTLTLGALLTPAVTCHAQQELPKRAKPYFNARDQRTLYTGPAEVDTSPDQLTEIRIGYFGSSDPDHPVTGPMWRAAQQAVNDANLAGGLQGKPFRLMPAWSENPWGTGIKQLTRLVYEEEVWAIVGGTDGPSTHLAEQVVAKARLALVSPVSTDKTVNLANVPWMFSLAPGDHLIAECMAPQIAQSVGDGTFVLISANSHDSYLLNRELRRWLDRLRIVPAYQFELKSETDHIQNVVRECMDVHPRVVVVVADAGMSAQVIRLLYQLGYQGCIFGGPSLGQRRFLGQLGKEVGKIQFPLLTGAVDVRAEAFEAWARSSSTHADRADSGGPLSGGPLSGGPLWPDADFTALHTYDAVQLTIQAIQKAGLNRVGIGRALRDLSPWQGLSGRVEWDGLGGNTRRPRLATITDGQPAPLPTVLTN